MNYYKVARWIDSYDWSKFVKICWYSSNNSKVEVVLWADSESTLMTLKISSWEAMDNGHKTILYSGHVNSQSSRHCRRLGLWWGPRLSQMFWNKIFVSRHYCGNQSHVTKFEQSILVIVLIGRYEIWNDWLHCLRLQECDIFSSFLVIYMGRVNKIAHSYYVYTQNFYTLTMSRIEHNFLPL